MKGESVFFIDDEKYFVKTGESITIFAGSKYYISNESADDLEFLVILNPSTNNGRTEI